MLPVPLNSSKMTSSMRLPVSISAVAMMVSEPPSSTLRAAAKKRGGPGRALQSITHEALGLFENHFRDLNVTLRWLVKGGTDDLALDGTLHVRDFFRALVDKEDD